MIDKDEEKVVSFFRPAFALLPPDGSNWLLALPVDVTFLAKEHSHKIYLKELTLRSKLNKAVYLEELKDDGEIEKYWVDSEEFSRFNSKFEVLSWEE